MAYICTVFNTVLDCNPDFIHNFFQRVAEVERRTKSAVSFHFYIKKTTLTVHPLASNGSIDQ